MRVWVVEHTMFQSSCLGPKRNRLLPGACDRTTARNAPGRQRPHKTPVEPSAHSKCRKVRFEMAVSVSRRSPSTLSGSARTTGATTHAVCAAVYVGLCGSPASTRFQAHLSIAPRLDRCTFRWSTARCNLARSTRPCRTNWGNTAACLLPSYHTTAWNARTRRLNPMQGWLANRNRSPAGKRTDPRSKSYWQPVPRAFPNGYDCTCGAQTICTVQYRDRLQVQKRHQSLNLRLGEMMHPDADRYLIHRRTIPFRPG